MPTVQQFRLPDAGEGLTEAEIVSWRVKPGDTVAVNDPIVEIETAKSLVELPSPYAGVITELLVAEGDTVQVGTPIIAVRTGGPATDIVPVVPLAAAVVAAVAAVAVADDRAAQVPAAEGAVTVGGRTSVLVGYGPRTTAATRRPRTHPAVIKHSEVIEEPAVIKQSGAAAGPRPAAPAPLAKPPVRKLARDLGIDLVDVPPTGPGGLVTRDDVERACRQAGPAASDRAASDRTASQARIPAGSETRIPIKGVRRATAAAMTASAFGAPHVTEWVQVDVTRSVRLVTRLRTDPGFEGVKVSPLLLVAKALLLAVRQHPGVNASWDAEAGEIVLKHQVNLGIAAATPRGLLVPNIKDAGTLSLHDLAVALGELARTAREGRSTPSDQAGGTITITNVGVFGVDGGTPILNPGEAAILAVGQIRQLPWVHKGKVKPRWVTTLALSFDHRLVDGDLGSRFLAAIAAILEDPATALLQL